MSQLGRSTRCEDGRLMRHDPQHDDPYLETDFGQCPECEGAGCGQKCPKCGCDEIYRDSVNVGVGILHGPYGCPECAWSESTEYDFSDGRSKVQPDGSVLDQWGGKWPAASSVARAAATLKTGEKP